MTKKTWAVVVAVFLTLGVVAVAAANPIKGGMTRMMGGFGGCRLGGQGPEGGVRMGGFPGLRGFFRGFFAGDDVALPDLGLTDEQAGTLSRLEDESFASMEALRTAISEKEHELRKLLLSKDPDEASAKELWAELEALVRQLQDQRAQHQEEMRGVFSDEQVESIREQMRETFRERARDMTQDCNPGMKRQAGRGPGGRFGPPAGSPSVDDAGGVRYRMRSL